MSSLFWGISMALAALFLPLSVAHATTIDFTSTALSGDRWRFVYAIHNDTLGAPLGPVLNYANQTKAQAR